MRSLFELCKPRASVFDETKREDVLNLSDLIEGNIDPKAFFEENPVDAKSVTARAVLTSKARAAAKAAREAVVRKGALDGGGLRKKQKCSIETIGESAGI